MNCYFYGWYMKCQNDKQTFAVIPAVHRSKQKETCSIQIITNSNVWTIDYKFEEFCKTNKYISIGENKFCEKGIKLSIQTEELKISGVLHFNSLSPLKYDIMGPFAYVPFLECRHSVPSMRHIVSGKININGQQYLFDNALGYWEGDSGKSFPKEYAWTQCFFKNGSLMLSVADIPFAGFHFTGIIGVILWKGKEYRIATYLGAKAVFIKNKIIRVIQGDLVIEARLLQANRRPLKAPTNGNMVRTIHESAVCKAFYKLRKGNRTIFSFETKFASFEYEYLA